MMSAFLKKKMSEGIVVFIEKRRTNFKIEKERQRQMRYGGLLVIMHISQ